MLGSQENARNTPKPDWNPDIPNPSDFKEGMDSRCMEKKGFENAFQIQWELGLQTRVIGYSLSLEFDGGG